MNGLQVGDGSVYAATRPGDVITVDDDPTSEEFGRREWVRSIVPEASDWISNGELSFGCEMLYVGTVERPGTIYVLDADDGTTVETVEIDPGVVDSTSIGRGSLWTMSMQHPFDTAPADDEYRIYRFGGDPSGPPPIVGNDPPQDLDGDGLYEDIDGNGELTVGDVQVLFENRKSEIVQNNAASFNFADNNPPDVTVGDVQALFRLFREQG